MSLKNRLAKLLIDPAFRNPGLLRAILSVDDAILIDLVKTLAPFKLLPALKELFTRCFAHFVSGEEISLAAATGLAALAPDRAAHGYLLVQAEEERTHLDHFREKLLQFGLGEAQLNRFLAPGFTKFGTTIGGAVERGDFVAGVLLQHFLIRRVLGLGDMPQIFLTFALSLLLMNVALLVFTANYRTLQTSYTEAAIHIGPLYIGVAKLIAFVLAMLLSAVVGDSSGIMEQAHLTVP